MLIHPSVCIDCDQSDQTVPVSLFQVQGRQYWIGPQHLSIFIHYPVRLTDELPVLKLAGTSESRS